MIAGTGVTGQSVARYLLARGESCAFASDQQDAPVLPASLEQVPVIALTRATLQSAERVVVSPGIPLAQPCFDSVRERLTNDIVMFSDAAEAPVTGITGTNGKSTVTTMLQHVAARQRPVVAAGGNLGRPALDLLEDHADLYILELSSYQLELAKELPLAVAVVVSLSPDHLDRYDSLADYYQTKLSIAARARNVVLSRDLPDTPGLDAIQAAMTFGLSAPVNEREFGLVTHKGQSWLAQGGELLLPVDALPVAGTHNALNALAALAAGACLGLDVKQMAADLEDYTPLPHRSEVVRRKHGVTWVNDSKATNVDAAIAAVTGLAGDSDLVLILGGEGKGADFQPLTRALAGRVRCAVLLGESADVLAQQILPPVAVLRAADMPEAVEIAAQQAREGDTVLLSPACASTDMFKDFAARGDEFRTLVEALR